MTNKEFLNKIVSIINQYRRDGHTFIRGGIFKWNDIMRLLELAKRDNKQEGEYNEKNLL